jgi:hypothetical protein
MAAIGQSVARRGGLAGCPHYDRHPAGPAAVAIADNHFVLGCDILAVNSVLANRIAQGHRGSVAGPHGTRLGITADRHRLEAEVYGDTFSIVEPHFQPSPPEDGFDHSYHQTDAEAEDDSPAPPAQNIGQQRQHGKCNPTQ